MPFGATFRNDVLKLLLNGTTIANLADNAGASPLTNLYLSLHTGDPSAGNQTTNEAAYTGYARASVGRNGSALVVTGDTASPAAAITFPECTAGSETYTHAAIGTAASGTGKILFSGPLSVNIPISNGIIPQIKPTMTITLT